LALILQKLFTKNKTARGEIKMRTQHVLCIYPFRTSKSFSNYLSSGAEEIAHTIENLVENISTVDMRIDDSVKPFIKDTTSLVAITVRWDDREEVMEVVNEIPSNILTVVCGKGVSKHMEEYFELCPNIDVIIRSDDEEAMREIVSGKPFTDIPGISYRNNGTVVHNAVDH
jgi:hypothetical protein